MDYGLCLNDSDSIRLGLAIIRRVCLKDAVECKVRSWGKIVTDAVSEKVKRFCCWKMALG